MYHSVTKSTVKLKNLMLFPRTRNISTIKFHCSLLLYNIYSQQATAIPALISDGYNSMTIQAARLLVLIQKIR